MKLSETQLRMMVRKIVRSSMLKNATYSGILEGVSDEFDQIEAVARERYNAAVAALAEYDDNLRLKDEYDAKYDALVAGGMSKAAAKRTVDLDPTVQFNKQLLLKKRQTLERDLASARDRLAQIRPDEFEFRRASRQERSYPISREFSTPIKFIDDVEPLEWHPWPQEVTDSSVPYGSRSSGDDSGVGVGPGEQWVALMFGGAVQGGRVNYDVLLADGTTWEVKQVLDKSDLVRPMVEGRNAIDLARRRLNDVINQINDFVSKVKEVKADAFDRRIVDFLQNFLDDNYDLIVKKGEISRERFIDLRGALLILRKIKRDAIERMNAARARDIDVGTGSSSVDAVMYARILRRLHDVGHAKEIELNVDELIVSTLEASAFDDPNEFITSWFESVEPSESFPSIDGLIAVNPNGFCIVPSVVLNDALKFVIVSQGVPRFRFLIPPK